MYRYKGAQHLPEPHSLVDVSLVLWKEELPSLPVRGALVRPLPVAPEWWPLQQLQPQNERHCHPCHMLGCAARGSERGSATGTLTWALAAWREEKQAALVNSLE